MEKNINLQYIYIWRCAYTDRLTVSPLLSSPLLSASRFSATSSTPRAFALLLSTAIIERSASSSILLPLSLPLTTRLPLPGETRSDTRYPASSPSSYVPRLLTFGGSLTSSGENNLLSTIPVCSARGGRGGSSRSSLRPLRPAAVTVQRHRALSSINPFPIPSFFHLPATLIQLISAGTLSLC